MTRRAEGAVYGGNRFIYCILDVQVSCSSSSKQMKNIFTHSTISI